MDNTESKKETPTTKIDANDSTETESKKSVDKQVIDNDGTENAVENQDEVDTAVADSEETNNNADQDNNDDSDGDENNDSDGDENNDSNSDDDEHKSAKQKKGIKLCLISDDDEEENDSDWVPDEYTEDEADHIISEEELGSEEDFGSEEGEVEDIEVSKKSKHKKKMNNDEYIKLDQQKLYHIMQVLKLEKFYDQIVEDGAMVCDIDMYEEEELIEMGMKKMEARRFIVRSTEIARFT